MVRGQPSKGSVLITYGNGGTAANCAGYANEIQRAAPLDVFILEYPGYQDRAGKPTETSFFAASSEAFKVLPTNGPIYLVGESLGSGVVCYLAGANSNRVAGILLLSPFNSVSAVAQERFPLLPARLLLLDHFASETYLQKYHGKVAITVDGRDTIVPEKFGRALYDGYSGPKKIWEYKEGGHIEIENPPVFWKEVIDFWQK